jgi:ankyrin repeat protein
MGIYDRDWYRESPRRLAGWYSELDTVGKVILFVFVGSLVALIVMKFLPGRQPIFPDYLADDPAENEVVEDRGIHAAIEDESFERVRDLLRHDPLQIRAELRKDCPDQPLHHAAAKGNVRLCELLLLRGAEINAPGDQGATPLHRAAENGHRAVVNLLLRYEADLDALDDRGFTPLHAAVRLEDPAVARLLLEGGARVTPDLFDRARNSPGGQEMVDLLRRYRKGR